MGPEMGLIGIRRLGQHHGLPVMVLGRGRRMMLPTVEPIARFRLVNHWRSGTCLQLLPTGSADESTTIQMNCCPLQLNQTTF